MVSINYDGFFVYFFPDGLSRRKWGIEITINGLMSSNPVVHFLMKLGAPEFDGYMFRVVMSSCLAPPLLG